MDDTFKNVALGLAAFLALHISLDARIHHAAKRQTIHDLGGTGSVSVDVRPSGIFGLELNDYESISITARGVNIDRLPFFTVPKPGWKGSIHHLKLRLEDFTLSGLPISLFTADIPHLSYDIGYAFYRSHLLLRGSQSGPAEILITPEGLRYFIIKKYNKILSDVFVSLDSSKIHLSGQASLLGFQSSISAEGLLSPRLGRYLDLTDALIVVKDKPVNSQVANIILNEVNPVLDTVKDLGIGDFFAIDHVRFDRGNLIISGRISLPVRDSVRFVP